MVGTDLLLVQAEEGTAVTLNQTGRLMWELIAAGCTATELADRLEAYFDVPRNQLERDVSEFIRQLQELKVLRAGTGDLDPAR
jgi:hypothetical protein